MRSLLNDMDGICMTEGKSVSVSVSIAGSEGGVQSVIDEDSIEFVEYDVAEIENRHQRILVSILFIPCHLHTNMIMVYDIWIYMCRNWSVMY
jgi:hypothetical protein